MFSACCHLLFTIFLPNILRLMRLIKFIAEMYIHPLQLCFDFTNFIFKIPEKLVFLWFYCSGASSVSYYMLLHIFRAHFQHNASLEHDANLIGQQIDLLQRQRPVKVN